MRLNACRYASSKVKSWLHVFLREHAYMHTDLSGAMRVPFAMP